MSILQVPGRHLPSLKHCCEIPERAALFRGFDSVHDRQMHLRGYSKECVYIYIYHLFLAWSFMSRVFLFTLIWISWWVCKLIVFSCSFEFAERKLQVNSRWITWEPSACLSTRCLLSYSYFLFLFSSCVIAAQCWFITAGLKAKECPACYFTVASEYRKVWIHRL